MIDVPNWYPWVTNPVGTFIRNNPSLFNAANNPYLNGSRGGNEAASHGVMPSPTPRFAQPINYDLYRTRPMEGNSSYQEPMFMIRNNQSNPQEGKPTAYNQPGPQNIKPNELSPDRERERNNPYANAPRGNTPGWMGEMARNFWMGGRSNPYPPNNGNPMGANNMPQFRTGGVNTQHFDPNTGRYGGGPREEMRWLEQPGSGNHPGYGGERDHAMAHSMISNPEVYGRFNFQQHGVPTTQGGYHSNPYFPSQGYMGGQMPHAGRYRPPMMDKPSGNWMDHGGYNYNLPNAFGSYPGYGQGNPYSQFMSPNYRGMFGFGG